MSAVRSRPRAPFQSHHLRWLFSCPILTGLNCRHDVEALEECKQSGGLFTDDRRSLVGLQRSDSDYRKPYQTSDRSELGFILKPYEPEQSRPRAPFRSLDFQGFFCFCNKLFSALNLFSKQIVSTSTIISYKILLY